MKSKFKSIYTIFGWLFLTFLLLSFNDDPPNDVAGAPPADGNTCANCHGGGSFDGGVSISGLPATIEPNTSYTITVTVSNPDGNAAKAGFQLVALDEDDDNAGNMSNASSGMGFDSSGDRIFAEHRGGQFFNASNQASWNFTWTAPASISGSSISMYAVGNITNSNGSTGGDNVVTSSVSGSFTSIEPLAASISSSTNVSCNGGNDGAATVSVTGGTEPYNYSWSGGAGNTATVTGLFAASYTVTVTDADNNSITADVTITEPTALSVSIVSLLHIDCGNMFGAVRVVASGGTPDYSYSWSNGVNNDFINGLSEGNYTVTATDSNNCMETFTVTIVDNSVFPTADPGGPRLVNCNMTEIVLDGTNSSTGPNFSYLWEAASGGNIVIGETSLTPTVNSAGIYILTVTNNSNGCTDQEQVTVTENFDTPTAIIQTPGELDCNAIMTLDGSASFGNNQISYLWTASNGGLIVSTANQSTVNISSAGTYTLSVRDNTSGCTDEVSVEVTNATAPTATISGENVINCYTPILTLDGTGSSEGANIEYLWTTDNGNITSGATALIAEVDMPGDYVFTVTDTETNCSTSETISISSNFDTPTADAGPDLNLDCTSTFIELDGNNSPSGSGISYNWTTADGNILAGANTLTPSVNEPGTYTIMVIDDESGCAGTDDMIVGLDMEPPVTDAGPDQVIGCTGSEVNLDGTGSETGDGLVIGWSSPDGNIVSGETTLTPLVDEAGTYILSIFNTNNGCAGSDEMEVIFSDGFDVNLTAQTNISCHSETNGSATVEVVGGIAPYTYEWSSGGIDATETGLAAGTHIVTVTDDVGCTNNLSVEITEPDTLLANAAAMDETSAGAEDGRVMVTPTGGTTPYDILWSNGATSAFVNNLPTGTYTVTVTDANNCESIETVVVNAAGCSLNIVSVQGTAVSCNGGLNGEATAIANGGTMPFSYNWSSGGMEQTETNLSAGTYSVTVTDNNGCTTTAEVTIDEPDILNLALDSIAHISCNGGMDGVARVMASGGTSPYQYTWLTTGSNDDTETGLAAGMHTISVMDANGCDETIEIEITEPDAISLTTSSTNETAPDATDGTATVMATGGTAPYVYVWDDSANQTTETATGLPSGTYTVSVTDANGCLASIEVAVGLSTADLVITSSTQDVACAGEATGSASVAVEGGLPPYSYEWSNDATEASVDGLTAGVYGVTVTDADNNSTSTTVTINEPEPLSADIEVTHETTANGANGTATITPTGGTPIYSIEWDDGATTGELDNLAPGEYGVTITDANDCVYSFNFTINSFDCGSISAAISTTDATCPDGEDGSASVSVMNGVAPFSYLWSNDAITAEITGLGTGTYSVTVTDNNGCETIATADIAADDLIPPVAVGRDIVRFLNEDGTFTINTDMIDDGSSDNCAIASLDLSITEFDCSNIGENTVQFSVTDASGNVSATTVTVTILDDDAPQITCPASLVVDGTCSAVVEYDQPVAMDNCEVVSLALMEGLESGANFPNGTTTMLFGAVDSSGNTATCSFEISVAGDGPDVEVEVEEPSCEGFNDGSILVTAIGGTPPYTFQFSVPNPNQVEAGQYGVTVSDAAGCTTTLNVVVDEPEAIIITIDEVTEAMDGESNGAIAVSIMGGVMDYTYEWMNSNGEIVSNEEDPFGLPPGDYVLSVSDQNDCTVVSDTITVDNITNINEVATIKKMELFPNPASEILNLNIELHQVEEVQLELFDFTGRSILQTAHEKISLKNYDFDVSDWATGVYWVKILVNQEVLVKKVVID